MASSQGNISKIVTVDEYTKFRYYNNLNFDKKISVRILSSRTQDYGIVALYEKSNLLVMLDKYRSIKVSKNN